MAFRKRNVPPGRERPQPNSGASFAASAPASWLRGVRPSPVSSHLTTSTGTSSLDGILGGHGGLVLGSTLLIQERGTTDFSGALTRFYTAEGLCQGHEMHLVGVDEKWVRHLPGAAERRDAPEDKRELISEPSNERMKIAWRYEKPHHAGDKVGPDQMNETQLASLADTKAPFCHTFDLTRQVSVPPDAKINYIPLSLSPCGFPLDVIMSRLSRSLKQASAGTVHRIVMPSVLNPAAYKLLAIRPEQFLRFLHSLHSLVSCPEHNATAILTLPLDLYPRDSALVRWAEHICSGVIELTPFPRLMDYGLSKISGSRSKGEQPQGMVNILKLPVVTDKGEGGAGANNSIGEDLAFTLGRRHFVINPFSLPPLDADQNLPQADRETDEAVAKHIQF